MSLPCSLEGFVVERLMIVSPAHWPREPYPVGKLKRIRDLFGPVVTADVHTPLSFEVGVSRGILLSLLIGMDVLRHMCCSLEASTVRDNATCAELRYALYTMSDAIDWVCA